MRRLDSGIELIIHVKSHDTAPIRSVHRIALVSENLRHERVEEGGRVRSGPVVGGGRRESKARQRWDDDVKCLAGVFQQELVEEVNHFEERARPAVQQDEGNGIWILGFFMNEVNGLVSNLSCEVLISVSSKSCYSLIVSWTWTFCARTCLSVPLPVSS